MISDNKRITQNSKFKIQTPPFFYLPFFSPYVSQPSPDAEEIDVLNKDEITTSTPDVQRVPNLRIG